MACGESSLQRRGMSTRRNTLLDLTADLFADRELRQRRAWARELGLDPARVDLLALPPVPPSEEGAPAQRAA